MPEEVAIARETPPPGISAGNEAKARWFELSLVLFVAFGASIAFSIHILVSGPGTPLFTFDQRWLTGSIQEMGCLALLGYVLWRRQLRFTDLGLRWSIRDLGVGLLIAALGLLAYYVSDFFVYTIHHAFTRSPVTGVTFRQLVGHPSLALVPFIVLNPFFEELIVRAYLMTEIKELTGSSTLAVALSVGIQFAYHLYYGWLRAIPLAFQFLVLAIYYAKFRRATPLIMAHEVFDILPILWLL